MEQLNLSAWREQLGRTGGKVGKGMPAVAGIATGLLQLISMTKMSEEVSTSLERDKAMNAARYVAAAGAFGGTVINMVGSGAEMVGTRVAGGGSKLANFGRFFGRAGAGVGCVAGLAMAVMDVMEGIKAKQEGQYGLMAVYLVSAAAGGGASICFFLIVLGVDVAWLPVAGWILAGIAFAAAILISLIKDNKIQEWLERSTWGTRDLYPDMHAEVHELNLALGV
jgi:hypothetical protein